MLVSHKEKFACIVLQLNFARYQENCSNTQYVNLQIGVPISEVVRHPH